MNFYTFFHLNLAYSSVEESNRAKIIKKCYWPLLELVKKYKLPFGIEASGLTLEEINSIDKNWILELRTFLNSGLCEFIGSGYAQIIGPLVPAEVNNKNLEIGNKIYKKLLGIQPRIALLNEQAYSSGLVSHYKKAKYKAIIMDWENPFRSHSKWKSKWKYFPQKAISLEGKKINVIWNHSIAFQKFQRYVHGELSLKEYLEYIYSNSRNKNNKYSFSLYGNDIEVINFRPKRFETEKTLKNNNEWERVAKLFFEITNSKKIKLIKPSQVLNFTNESNSGKELCLESANQPCPTKKQIKYNILRWAVTGRDDLTINTECWKIYNELKKKRNTKEKFWKELCYLWGSDFRTHITEKRWIDYLDRINKFKKKIKIDKKLKKNNGLRIKKKNYFSNISVKYLDRFLEIKGKNIEANFDYNRGCALNKFIDYRISDQPLCGSILHGYYDDIMFGADFYSGHLVFEPLGKHKISDLVITKPKIEGWKYGKKITIKINRHFGKIKKSWYFDELNSRLGLSYSIRSNKKFNGSLRLGFITLYPDTFDKNKLHYTTHNGGDIKEKFFFK